MDCEEVVNLADLTDEELRKLLVHWLALKHTADANVKAIINERLCRMRHEIHDGYWTAYGFVPKDD